MSRGGAGLPSTVFALVGFRSAMAGSPTRPPYARAAAVTSAANTIANATAATACPPTRLCKVEIPKQATRSNNYRIGGSGSTPRILPDDMKAVES